MKKTKQTKKTKPNYEAKARVIGSLCGFFLAGIMAEQGNSMLMLLFLVIGGWIAYPICRAYFYVMEQENV